MLILNGCKVGGQQKEGALESVGHLVNHPIIIEHLLGLVLC